jgi:transposase
MKTKSRELSTEVKKMIVKSVEMGGKISNLAQTLSIPRTTIHSVIKKFRNTGSVENVPRKGRKKLFTERDGNAVLRLVKKDVRSHLRDITNTFNEEKDQTFSCRTIHRHLRRNGYSRRVVKKRTEMVVRMEIKKKRVLWCRERRHWTVNQYWNKFIYSDESQIVLGKDNQIYIWRKEDEANNPHLVCPPWKRRISLMIWGCVCYHGDGTLTPVECSINGEKYIDMVDNNLWPVIARHFTDSDYIFMDDNAPVHRVRIVNYVTENNITTTEMPAQSPDLNIIENIWLKIKRDLQSVATNIGTGEELFQEINISEKI